jgi:K+-sensing histidine kinase KdpD
LPFLTARTHPVRVTHRWLAILFALLGPAVLALAAIPLRGHIANANLALALVVAVLLASVLGGRTAAVVAALSAAASFDVVLTQPYGSLRIFKSDDLTTTVLLAVIGLIAGEVVEWARRNGAHAATTAAHLRAVYQRAELTAGAESLGGLIALANDELSRMLDLKSCRFVAGPPPMNMAELRHNFVRVPPDVQPAARGLVALPVRIHGRLEGNFVLAFPENTVGLSLSPEQRHAATALADQVAVGLLRFR